MQWSPKVRVRAFLLFCILCIAAVVIYALVGMRARRPAQPAAPSAQTTSSSPPSPLPRESPAATETAKAPEGEKGDGNVPRPKAAAPPLKTELKPVLLYFRANALGSNYGKLAVAPVGHLEDRHYAADLECDRVHASDGMGVCIHADRGMFTKYYAIGFDDQMQRKWSFQLNGLPSRVRVSPSGKLAAITVFLAGQSYASLDFATQTSIRNAETGEAIIDDLEKLSVTRDGVPFKEKDFNFWGVTFAQDENRFYATLWSKAKTYLVEGDIRNRTAKVIHDTVECPSLSPDNTRIAFKKREEGPRLMWHLTVLDLKTGQETPLGESRSVDDQVEWLDNEHILYALSESEKGASASTDIWVLPATAGGAPQILVKAGYSPAVVRRAVVISQR